MRTCSASVLHNGARIGRDAEVVDSVVGACGVVDDGARIGAGSLVGAGGTVAAHARLAGARVRGE